MNSRFFLILTLLTLLYGGWAFLAHSQAESIDLCYVQLAELPVYAYVADTTRVQPVLEGIRGIPGIASFSHETGYQVVRELIESYDIPLSEEQILEYHFPDLITVYFKPGASNIPAKASLMSLLRVYLEETELDSQSSSFGSVMQELKHQKQRATLFTIYASVLMLIIFVFVRISFDLHLYLKEKRRLISVVDLIRHRKMKVSHTWLMMIFPILVVAAIYYAGAYLGSFWQAQIYAWDFVGMVLSSILGSLVITIVLRSYEHDRILENNGEKHESQED